MTSHDERDEDYLPTDLVPTRTGASDEGRARKGSAVGGPALLLVYAGHTRAPAYEVCPLHDEVTLVGRASAEGGVKLPRDDRASRLHATLRRRGDSVVLHNESRNGTFVDGERQDEPTSLDDGAVLRFGDTLFVYRSRYEDAPDVEVPALLGESQAARSLRMQLQALATVDARVLILGETGTGKDVAATALHALSGRAGACVPLNCGGIPESLAESVLFGHRKGAFTGAVERQDGAFHKADGGTLFLDEIGELPLSLQPKLLRALDHGHVTRVGEVDPVPVDARVIAATNRELLDEVERGRFRADLYARLSDITLRLPPLRERREDVLLLLAHALDAPRALAPELAEALVLHAWPFNVRELFKVATELRVRAPEGELSLGLVEERLRPRAEPTAQPRAEAETSPNRTATQPAEDAPPPDRDGLEALLVKHRGNVVRIARDLGRARRTVYRWMEQHGLRLEDYRGGDDGP